MSVADAKYALSAKVLEILAVNGIPVARENVPPAFDTPMGSKWARQFTRDNVPQPFTLGAGGDDKANGFYQLDILYPAGGGTEDADNDLELFRSGLNRQTFTHNGQYVKVMSVGAPRRGSEGDNWYVMTININWEALVQV